MSFAYVLRLTRTSVAENLDCRLRAHRDRQGAVPAASRSRARAAQLADPGGHVPRRRPRALMGGAIVTEGIFNINGVGGTIYQASSAGEAPTVVSFVTRADRHLPDREPARRPACTPCSIRGSAMSEYREDRTRSPAKSFRGTARSCGTGARRTPSSVDRAPTSMWNDAWRDLRKRPLFIIVGADHPASSSSPRSRACSRAHDPRYCNVDLQHAAAACPGTRSDSTGRAVTCTRAPCTALARP